MADPLFKVGLLVGGCTGLVVVIILIALYFTVRRMRGGRGSPLELIPEVLSLPSVMFGGPLLATKALKHVDWGASLGPYANGLLIGLLVVAGFPLYMVARESGKMLGRLDREGSRGTPVKDGHDGS